MPPVGVTTPQQTFCSESALNGKSGGKAAILRRLIRFSAWLLLLAAFIAGHYLPGSDYSKQILVDFPDSSVRIVQDDPPVYRITAPGGETSWMAVTTTKGYGGPMQVGVQVTADNKLKAIEVFEHRETPAYLTRILDNSFFMSQFPGKSASDDYIIHEDIDVVSGATLTSRGISNAARNAAHLVATDYLHQAATWREEPVRFGLAEISVILLVVLAFCAPLQKIKLLRKLYLIAVIAVLGFWLNASLSIAALTALPLGYLPDFGANLIWWILAATTLGSILFMGRNIYCHNVCPFHAVQSLLTSLSGGPLKLPKQIARHARSVANGLLWLSLMIIFISRNPSLGAYEPFSLVFSLEGTGIQWYMLPASLLGSLLLSNFWCACCCPGGRALSLLTGWRNKAVAQLSSKKEPKHV